MPDWRREIERRLPGAAGRSARLDEVVQELAEHLDERYDELRAAGTSEADATTMVLDELNESNALQQEIALMTSARIAPPPIGEDRRAPLVADVWQDVRFAARMLRKSPGFTAVAMLTLALGIGANTAIFTVINAVMLRPLPFHEPDRLVRIWESNPPLGWPRFGVSFPNYLDWAAQTRAFEAIAATAGAAFTLNDGGNAERVVALAATRTFLPVLAATPALGRNFQPEEDRPGGNTRVVLLTHSYWQRRFGGDPDVVGRALTLNNQPYTVVGVLPETFAWGAQAGSSAAGGGLEMIVPLAPDPKRSRADHRLSVIGRLKDGVSIDQAQFDLAAIAEALQRQYPESNEGWTVLTQSFYNWIVPEETRRSLAIFAIAVIAVLLIACSNVASLLLARASARHREISVRLALGARRSRVIRQLLVEAVLLSLIAGVAGLAVAFGATRALQSMSPDNLPRLNEISVDVRVIAFGFGVSLLTGVLFGLVPAFTGLRVDVSETLKEGTRGGSSSPARQRVRGALVIAELALSVTLLVGAGMLLRSFWQVQQVDPGFATERLLTFQVNLPLDRYDSQIKAWSYYERLLRELASVPGVRGVATTSGVPMSPGNTTGGVRIPGREVVPGEQEGSADWRIISPDYFRTMSIPLRGREFTAADTADAQQVTIISELFAERYWPGEDALGKSVVLRSAGDVPRTIVGIARNVRSFGLDADAAPMSYVPSPTVARWNPTSIVVRTEGEPTAMVGSIRAALRAIDPAIPPYGVTTADALLATTMGPRRFTMFLVTSFATIAVVLASVGLFGVMAYLVSQRAREIGIRLALGARPADVFRSIIGRGFALAAAGALIGVTGAYWLTPLMESFLFEVSAVDPITFITAPVALVAVALLACYLPARRAMRVDPIVALRQE
jgi:putative ABC transport system permease protein